jgi:hypothetical protein
MACPRIHDPLDRRARRVDVVPAGDRRHPEDMSAALAGAMIAMIVTFTADRFVRR